MLLLNFGEQTHNSNTRCAFLLGQLFSVFPVSSRALERGQREAVVSQQFRRSHGLIDANCSHSSEIVLMSGFPFNSLGVLSEGRLRRPRRRRRGVAAQSLVLASGHLPFSYSVTISVAISILTISMTTRSLTISSQTLSPVKVA